MKKAVLSSVVGMMLLGSTALANATVINFDDLASGTVVDSQYQGLGVKISGTLGNDGTGSQSPVYTFATSAAPSQPNYAGQPNNAWDGSIIFDFVGNKPTTFGLTLIDSADSWVSIYDSGLNLLQTINGSGAIFETITFTSGTAISRAIASGDFYAIDDVTFESSVPEPSTMLLFGIGLAGVGFARRRFVKK